MKIKKSLNHAGLITLLIPAIGFSLPELPNIVIIYADDLGWGDLSGYNPEAAYETPRLDRMAEEGIKFTDAHSPSTICSPSRYGLYSGQQIYRATNGGGGAFEGPCCHSYLNRKKGQMTDRAGGSLTIAEMVKSKGYTTGVFGKWHVGLTWRDDNNNIMEGGVENSKLVNYLNSTPIADGPQTLGFDESFITPNCPNTDPLYVYIENGMVPVPADHKYSRSQYLDPLGDYLDGWLWDNDEGWVAPGYDMENADLLFFQKTKEFIINHEENSPDDPFFVVMSTQIAHAPVLPAEEFRGATGAKGGPRGDFIWELDVLTGRVLDLLDSLGIDENTLVMFNADNGAETVHYTRMMEEFDHDASGGWRGMKRDGWEGGHRVPFIARWPAAIPAGQVSDQMTNTTDIFATVASVVGYTLDDEDATDSFDMLPAMLGIQDENESIRPHLLTQSFRGEFQIRQSDWKYLDHMGSGGNNYNNGGAIAKYLLPETAPNAEGQLFHLGDDPGETKNLYFDESSKRIELRNLLSELKSSGRSAPTGREPIGIENIALAVKKPGKDVSKASARSRER